MYLICWPEIRISLRNPNVNTGSSLWLWISIQWPRWFKAMKKWHKIKKLSTPTQSFKVVLYSILEATIRNTIKKSFCISSFIFLVFHFPFLLFFFSSSFGQVQASIFLQCWLLFLHSILGAETVSCWQDLIWGSFAICFTAGVKLLGECQKVTAVIN